MIHGYDGLVSGTSSQEIAAIHSDVDGEDVSKDVVNIKPYKAPYKMQLDDDLTSHFGNDFKFPRIEGIDDEPAVPEKKKLQETSFIGNALLGGNSKVKDYEDQADDVLAETLDADLAAANEKRKREEETQKEEQQ